MGLSLSALRFIVRQHRHRPLGAAVCTLGRNRVVATYDRVITMMREEGWDPHPLPEEQDLRTNIPSWKDTPNSSNTSDVVFFKLLGVETLVSLDVSDYEGADVICDLNKPLPSDLLGCFDTVIDSGTIEHVHDVHAALRNINLLANSSGTVMHFAPTSNYIDHGYHQLSPIFFIDYYAVNRFERCDVWLIEHIRPFATMDKWHLYRHEYGTPIAPFAWLWSRKAWATIVVAKKGPDSTAEVIPLQGNVSPPWRHETAGVSDPRLRTLRRRLEPGLRRSPWLWKLVVRVYLWGHYLVRRKATNHPYVGKM